MSREYQITKKRLGENDYEVLSQLEREIRESLEKNVMLNIDLTDVEYIQMSFLGMVTGIVKKYVIQKGLGRERTSEYLKKFKLIFQSPDSDAYKKNKDMLEFFNVGFKYC